MARAVAEAEGARAAAAVAAAPARGSRPDYRRTARRPRAHPWRGGAGQCGAERPPPPPAEPEGGRSRGRSLFARGRGGGGSPASTCATPTPTRGWMGETEARVLRQAQSQSAPSTPWK